MPRYVYEQLYFTAYEPVYFDLKDPLALRKAVEYLRTREPSPYAALVAVTRTTAGPFKLLARVRFTLADVTGKKPAQVWEMIDADG